MSKPFNILSASCDIAETYTRQSIRDLCEILGIDQKQRDWPQQLAPCASVVAATISAASAAGTILAGPNWEGPPPKLEDD
jgi:hypothetical protein